MFIDAGKNPHVNEGELLDDKSQINSFSFGMAYLMRLRNLMANYEACLRKQRDLDFLLKEDFDALRGKTQDSIFVFSIYVLSTMHMKIFYEVRKANLLYSILSYLFQ